VVAEVAFSERQAPTDLTGYKALRFWVKGDGTTHTVKMHRMAVKDHAFPMASFATTSTWTQVTLPLADFAQPAWAQQVAGGLSDVHLVVFAPGADKSAFDFSIDQLELVK
jgi:hypothetical protein